MRKKPLAFNGFGPFIGLIKRQHKEFIRVYNEEYSFFLHASPVWTVLYCHSPVTNGFIFKEIEHLAA
jgi:hypothetical protein